MAITTFIFEGKDVVTIGAFEILVVSELVDLHHSAGWGDRSSVHSCQAQFGIVGVDVSAIDGATSSHAPADVRTLRHAATAANEAHAARPEQIAALHVAAGRFFVVDERFWLVAVKMDSVIL